MLENRNEKILDHARSKKFEFHLEPESAIDFKVGPIGLGPYHFARDTDNAAQEPDEELSRVKQTLMKIKEERDREHDIEEEQAVPLVMNLADMEMTNTESKAIEQKNSEQQIKLEEHFVSKEKAYLQDLQNHNQRIISDDIYLDDAYMYIQLDKKVTSGEADVLLKYISDLAGFPFEWIKDISISGNLVVFRVKDIDLNVLCKIIEDNHGEVKVQTSLHIISCSRGNVDIQKLKGHKSSSENKKFAFITIVVVSATALGVLICLLCLFAIKRRQYLRQKLFENVSPGMMKQKPEDDVEQLIRTDGSGRNFISQMWPFKTKSVNVQQADLSRSASKLSSPLNNTQITDLSNRCDNSIENTPVIIDERADSNRSSASSWSEEPVSSINMDITTGHAILSYMENHLNDKNRLDKEWEDLCNYEADRSEVFTGKNETNMSKNRYSDIIPYDHNRVKLEITKEKSRGSDYINASLITDDDPKNPAYIASQGPLGHTTNDFWKMVWDQNSVIIVSLCRTVEYGSSKCHQYWPQNGFETYDDFEVHLVSEHVWCEDYLVRSFYLKNKSTNQTRTVTQFQFLTWPENSMPPNIKAILDFRRKVNKSYNRKSFPIIVHCNDGIGRTGTFIMIDMILNKILKEAKEIDLAATLEYLRDQRKDMIKNKNQFEFTFAVITEEVQNMLKTLIK